MSSDSRRQFLKNALSAGTFLAFCSPFKKLFSLNIPKAPLPKWGELVEYARWCPTVHNLQPHKLKIISESEAELYYDPARLLPVGDPDCTFVTVAMGIFVEHLSVAATGSGSSVEITEVFGPITTSSLGLTKFARLKLTKSIFKLSFVSFEIIPLKEIFSFLVEKIILSI